MRTKTKNYIEGGDQNQQPNQTQPGQGQPSQPQPDQGQPQK